MQQATKQEIKGGSSLRVKISKSEFEKLYKNKTNKIVADHYGVSITTVVNWANKLGLRKDTGNSSRYEFV